LVNILVSYVTHRMTDIMGHGVLVYESIAEITELYTINSSADEIVERNRLNYAIVV